MRPLKATRVRDGVLRIEMVYGVTVDEEFLKTNPAAQKQIIKRDLLQSASDVIEDTDFEKVEVIEEAMKE